MLSFELVVKPLQGVSVPAEKSDRIGHLAWHVIPFLIAYPSPKSCVSVGLAPLSTKTLQGALVVLLVIGQPRLGQKARQRLSIGRDSKNAHN
ncbi:MAG: hypothetical protein NT154_00065 [Verrucomicrobia bacterium]|nr:hypothetical protein [Verrucomicrobiota bacterium]